MYRQLIYIVIILLYSSLSINAQIRVYTEVYTSKNGLPQNNVNDMVEDTSGFYWLATDDGLSRFDGYSFVNHKISTNQFHCSLNNQFDQIDVDAFNNIWARNTLGQALLINQSDHSVKLFPDPKENRGVDYTYIKNIKLIKNTIWLLGKEKGLVKVNKIDDKYVTSRFCHSDSVLGTIVNDVISDNEGYTWLLTNSGLGMLNKEASRIVNSYYTSADVSFYDMIENKTDLLFACNKGLVVRFDKLKKRFSEHKTFNNEKIQRIYSINEEEVLLVGTDAIKTYHIQPSIVSKSFIINGIQFSWNDEIGNVWIVDGSNKLHKFNIETKNIEKLDFTLSSRLFDLEQKRNKKFPFVYHDNKDGILYPLYTIKKISEIDPDNIHRVLSSNDKIFWTKKNAIGVQKHIAVNSTMQFIKCSNTRHKNFIVTAACEDHLGRLWIATSDRVITIYNSNIEIIGYLDKNGKINSTPCVFGSANIIYLDRKNNIWIGGNYDFCKLSFSDSKLYKTRNFSLESNTPQGTVIKDILEDKNGHIWIATDGDGLQLLDYNDNSYSLINRRNELKNSYPPTLLKTNCLYEDSNGNIWIGSNEGVAIFSSEITQARFLKFFYYNPENSNMTTSVVSGLFQDKDGKMWIASYGGGMLKTTKPLELGDTPEFVAYNKANNKLYSDLVLSVEEDADGQLWFVTEQAVVKYDKNLNKSEVFGFIEELGHETVGRQILVRTRKGAFILGSQSGFYKFDPKTIKKNGYKPPMVFTRFLLFNNDVDITSAISPLKEDVNLAQEIILKHKQNVFSFEYAALDFLNSSGIEYAYKLENFEENWNYVGKQRIATYTNLPPGEYIFRVKSTNGEGNWCENDKSLKVIVLPSFWQTYWAWIIYIVLSILILGGIIYAYLSFYKMRSKMQFEQEISTLKMQFFTDISHELRTPLTLIDAPLENVLQNNKIDKEDREQLEIVKNNTKRMLRLLTQILDFRKLQSKKMRLKVEKVNIFDLIEKCCNNFRQMAENRNIEFTVLNNTIDCVYWVDNDKMDTVMFNLLSNAFKFTPDGKKITIILENQNNDCLIHVSDEGCGMPKDKLGVIFERFNTLRPKSLTNQSGTGIGLSLVKEILDLHKATITVESQENRGSEFTIRLKPGTSHFDDITAEISLNDNNLPEQVETQKTSSEISDKTDILKLLVIEDNDDLRRFVVSVLSKNYKVIEAENGMQGYKKTIDEMPDFVLSDIMMPVMDGFEYVSKVRENKETTHIPIVLLSAKTDIQSKVECLKMGANDYITKPFNMAYLQARIDNIIADKKKMQEWYRRKLQNKQLNIVEDREVCYNTEKIDVRDEEFMKKIVDYVNAHIDDPNLSPEELANGMKVSRWNLSCKIKSLVGQPPVEFIKDIRLNKAAELIKIGEMNMTQIAYMIGMTDSRYFSRCFKQKFGMTPTEFKNNKD